LEEHIAYSSLNLFHVLSENDNWMVATKTLLFGFWIVMLINNMKMN
jgi:hypothetical protein